MRGLQAGWVLAVALAGTPVLDAADPIHVSVDVKPGDTPTTVEVERGGMIPIAILTTPQFDATTVDTMTIHVGPTGTEAEVFRAMTEDVNRDGRTDLLMLVRLQEMSVKCGDKVIRVTGKTKSGADIEGSESVIVEGCAVR